MTPHLQKFAAMMLLPILEEIQSYTRAVEKKEIQCDLACCARCGEPASFKLHDRRRRTYLVRVERLVHTVLSLLTRWKCERCAKSFTLYPSFALPRKRYVRQEVFRRAGRYLEEDQESYRKAVKVDTMAVFHKGQGKEIDERSLAHTTVHRWIGFLSSLQRTCRQALRLLREKSPSSEVFRKILPIAPWKYRSDERRRVLQDSRRLLVAEGEYRSLFGISIFPRLATLCGWR